jgi:hypothetical protein
MLHVDAPSRGIAMQATRKDFEFGIPSAVAGALWK